MRSPGLRRKADGLRWAGTTSGQTRSCRKSQTKCAGWPTITVGGVTGRVSGRNLTPTRWLANKGGMVCIVQDRIAGEGSGLSEACRYQDTMVNRAQALDYSSIVETGSFRVHLSHE